MNKTHLSERVAAAFSGARLCGGGVSARPHAMEVEDTAASAAPAEQDISSDGLSALAYASEIVGGGIANAASTGVGDRSPFAIIGSRGSAESAIARSNDNGTSTAKRAPELDDGTTLDPPIDKVYSRIEVIALAMKHGKEPVIKAIVASSYRPKERKLRDYFPSLHEKYDDDTIKALLLNLEKGSDGWMERVEQISSCKKHGGRSKLYIYRVVEYFPPETDDSFNEELARVNEDVTSEAAGNDERRPVSPDPVVATTRDDTMNEDRDPTPSVPAAIEIIRNELHRNGPTQEIIELAHEALAAQVNGGTYASYSSLY